MTPSTETDAVAMIFLILPPLDCKESGVPRPASGRRGQPCVPTRVPRCTERRLYQSLWLPAGVPSDQFVSTTANTRISGSPFICDCSFGEKNQGVNTTGEPSEPAPQSLPSITGVKNIR